jgi:hypothetical protein
LRTVVDYLADLADYKLISDIIKLKVIVDEESFSIPNLRAQAKSSLQYNHSVLSSDQLSSDHQQTALPAVAQAQISVNPTAPAPPAIVPALLALPVGGVLVENGSMPRREAIVRNKDDAQHQETQAPT